MCDAAAQERSHDEPFGCPYELHRVDQVAFREDGQSDRVVQQDERDDEQGSAEEQQHQPDQIDTGFDGLCRIGNPVHAVEFGGLGDEGFEFVRVRRIG